MPSLLTRGCASPPSSRRPAAALALALLAVAAPCCSARYSYLVSARQAAQYQVGPGYPVRLRPHEAEEVDITVEEALLPDGRAFVPPPGATAATRDAAPGRATDLVLLHATERSRAASVDRGVACVAAPPVDEEGRGALGAALELEVTDLVRLVERVAARAVAGA